MGILYGLSLVGFFLISPAFLSSEGKFINPITDICWGCVFPIHVSGVNVTPAHDDLVNYEIKPFCSCVGLPPKLGIPLAFWEPAALIDVTPTPYRLVAWGGASIATADVRKRGSISHVGESGRSSFYNVHYYNFPVLHWLDLLTDFSCLDSSELSVTYLSEFDPFWDDDQWAAVLNPEIFLFSNPAAQAACIADCVTASAGAPQDELFWCAGCMGSLYPLVGHVAHHVGAIQASYLVVHRLLSKLHSIGMGTGFKKGDFCDQTVFPRIQKTIYKTQLVHPIANTKAPCQPLGKSDLLWGSGKSFPYGGEEFVYLIWKKKHCCLDAVQPTAKLTGLDTLFP
jgi:conjugal transfer pilus assembly protein TraU